MWLASSCEGEASSSRPAAPCDAPPRSSSQYQCSEVIKNNRSNTSSPCFLSPSLLSLFPLPISLLSPSCFLSSSLFSYSPLLSFSCFLSCFLPSSLLSFHLLPSILFLFPSFLYLCPVLLSFLLSYLPSSTPLLSFLSSLPSTLFFPSLLPSSPLSFSFFLSSPPLLSLSPLLSYFLLPSPPPLSSCLLTLLPANLVTQVITLPMTVASGCVLL